MLFKKVTILENDECMSVSEHVYSASSDHRDQRVSDSLELEIKEVGSCLTGVGNCTLQAPYELLTISPVLHILLMFLLIKL